MPGFYFPAFPPVLNNVGTEGNGERGSGVANNGSSLILRSRYPSYRKSSYVLVTPIFTLESE